MNNKNKQRVSLTESQLRQMITECVNEAMEDEGFINQLGQGVKSFFGNGYGKNNPNNFRNTVSQNQTLDNTTNWFNKKTPMNFNKRINAFKKGYKGQGVIDTSTKVIDTIKNYVDQNILNWNDKLGTAMNKLSAMEMRQKRDISRANNDIYNGMTVGGPGNTQQINTSKKFNRQNYKQKF